MEDVESNKLQLGRASKKYGNEAMRPLKTGHNGRQEELDI